MTTVFDVAKYILDKCGPMSAMKLQKLAYYSQAWALVWDDEPLFVNRIEAWANGPVVRDLYEAHRGRFTVTSDEIAGYTTGILTQTQTETIDEVIRAYDKRSAQWLSNQTHSESPWQNARQGLAESERGDVEITHEAMAEYYGSLE